MHDFVEVDILYVYIYSIVHHIVDAIVSCCFLIKQRKKFLKNEKFKKRSSNTKCARLEPCECPRPLPPPMPEKIKTAQEISFS